MEARKADRWFDGDAYDAYVGRWSRLVAREFLAWLGAEEGLRWLDVGSGTGALSSAVLEASAPAVVQGVDASTAYVELARRRIDDPRVRFAEGDAAALAFYDEFDVAMSGLVLNFVPDPLAAVGGMARAVVPGGRVAAYVWDYAGRMEMMRVFWDVALARDPAVAELDEGLRFSLCKPAALTALWLEAGLSDVQTAALDVPTTFTDFDDYWRPFEGGQGPAPGYLMSLSEADRKALREDVRAALPIAADGSIALVARAWGVKGVAVR